MTTNYLVNVPKLKGLENYNEWIFAAKNFLILENLMHCIKPDSGKIIEAADDASKINYDCRQCVIETY